MFEEIKPYIKDDNEASLRNDLEHFEMYMQGKYDDFIGPFEDPFDVYFIDENKDYVVGQGWVERHLYQGYLDLL